MSSERVAHASLPALGRDFEHFFDALDRGFLTIRAWLEDSDTKTTTEDRRQIPVRPEVL